MHGCWDEWWASGACVHCGRASPCLSTCLYILQEYMGSTVTQFTDDEVLWTQHLLLGKTFWDFELPSWFPRFCPLLLHSVPAPPPPIHCSCSGQAHSSTLLLDPMFTSQSSLFICRCCDAPCSSVSLPCVTPSCLHSLALSLHLPSQAMWLSLTFTTFRIMTLMLVIKTMWFPSCSLLGCLI